MQSSFAQVPAVVLERDGLFAGEQLGDDAQSVFKQPARLALLQSNHNAVGGQRTRANAKHRSPARQMVEEHDALRKPQRIVVRDADHAGAELDVPGALGG